MAGHEHQAQQVILDFGAGGLRQRFAEIRRHVIAARHHVSAEFIGLATGHLRMPQAVERTSFGRGGKPGGRVVRHALPRPLLQRGDQSVLRQFLGQADVAHHARDRGDDLRGFLLPYRLDRTLGRYQRHTCHS